MIPRRILIYGYGNVARMDDALGIIFAGRMEQWALENKISNISFEVNYQLDIEDSLLISDYEIIIFVDSSKTGENFVLKKIAGDTERTFSFTTHKTAPESVVTLSGKLYDKFPDSYLVTIRGYLWEIGEELSSQAEDNLEQALLFTQEWLLNNDFITFKTS